MDLSSVGLAADDRSQVIGTQDVPNIAAKVAPRLMRSIVKPDEASGGAAKGIRTPDPVITNDVLYRLSYCG
jgi:hypothetical protein